MLTKRQVNETVRLLKNATLSDLSEVVHSLALEVGEEAVKLQLGQMVALMNLPPIYAPRDCVITIVEPGGAAIQSIKLIREILGCGLKDAKDMYDSREIKAPVKVAKDLIERLRLEGNVLKVQQ